MAELQGTWSIEGSGNESKAVFKVREETKITITGLQSAVGLPTTLDTNNHVNFNLTADMLNGTGVAVEGTNPLNDFEFVLANDVATKAKPANLEISDGKVQGTLTDYYTTNGTSVTYTAAATETKTTFATITGLTDTTGLAVDNTGNIEIAKDNLPGSTVSIAPNSSLDTTNIDLTGYSFKFTLTGATNNKVGFEENAANDHWTVTSGETTAKFQHTIEKGWTINDSGSKITYTPEVTKDLVTITNLASEIEASEDKKSVGTIVSENFTKGIEISGNDVVISSKDVLGKNAGVITTLVNGEGKNYTLKFTTGEGNLDTDSDGKVGFEKTTAGLKWTINNNGTGNYTQDIEEGWTLTDGNKISYTAKKEGTSGKILATVSGLSNSATTEGQDANVILEDTGKTLKLKKAALATDPSTPAKIVNGKDDTDTTYKLALDDEVPQAPEVDSDSEKKQLAIVDGDVQVQGKLKDYYTLNNENEVSYTAEQDNVVLAKITGLNNPSLTDGSANVEFNKENGEITLKAGALGESNITLTIETIAKVSDVGTYSLKLDTEVNTSEKQKDSTADASAELSFEGGVKVTSKYMAYYKPDQEQNITSITYHEPAEHVLATIEGLGEGAKAGTVALGTGDNAKTIYISQDALTTSGVSLTNALTNDGSYGYKLALEGSTPKDNKDVFGFAESDKWADYNSTTGTATYKHVTAEGWTLNSDTFIKYSKETEKDNFTISGLTGDIKVGLNKVGDKTVIGLEETKEESYQMKTYVVEAITVDQDKNVTISTDLLGKDASKTVTVSGDGYTFKIKGNGQSDTPADTVGLKDHKSDGRYWTLESDGTAKYQYKIDAGWKVENGEIVYYKEEIKTLATITGLKDAALDTSNNKNIAGVTVTESSGTYTITLDTGKLGDDKIELTKGDDAATGDIFKLAIKDKAQTDGQILEVGFENKDGTSKSWKLDDTTATYQYEIKEGWTLAANSQSIEHTASEIKKLAELKGLASDITEDKLNNTTTKIIEVTEEVADPQTLATIKLYEGVLTGTTSVKYSKLGDGNYELKLTETTDHDNNPNTIGFEDSNKVYKFNSGTVTYQYNTAEGWTLDNDTVTYTKAKEGETANVLATITGLKSEINLEPDGKIGDDDAITYDDGEKTFKLAKDVLGIGTVTITDGTAAAADVDYKIGFISIETGTDGDGNTTLGFNNKEYDSPNSNKWSFSEGTATYTHTTGEGWTLDKTTGKISYTAKTPTVLATISGLKTGITLEEDGKVGGNDALTATDATPKITITNAVLSETTEATVTSAEGYSFELSGGANATTIGLTDHSGTATDYYYTYDSATGTATLNYDIDAGWTLDGGKITHSDKVVKTLATISGLKTGLELTNNGKIGNDAAITYVDDDKTFKLAESVLGKGTITVEKGADSSFVYRLALTDNATKIGFGNENGTNKYWTATNGTATYQYNVDEGWTLATDKKSITYTPTDTKTEVKITGLNVANTNKADGIDGISLDSNTFTLDKRVLATTDGAVAELTNGEDVNTNYKLGIDTTSEDNKVSNDTTQKNVWALDNGTATYNKITPGHYALDGDSKKITYTAEKVDETLANVTGLATDLAISGDRKTIQTGRTNVITVVDTDGSEAITITEGALNQKDIENTTADSKYKLVIEGVAASEENNQTWSTSGGTATLKVNISEGYTATEDGKTIKYTAKEDGKVIMVISGLNSAIKDKISSDGSSIEGIVIDGNGKQVILSKDVLGTSTTTNAKFTTNEGSYTLALEDATTPTATDFWTISGTTAVYKNAVPAYYKIEADGSVKYYAEDVKSTYATIKNLASGLIVGTADHKDASNNAVTGKLGYLDESGAFVEAISINTTDKKVTVVKKEALGTSTATLDGDYTFVFGGGETFTPERSYTWEVSNKTKAIMKATIGEGYTLGTDSKSIKHSDAKESTILTISGLSDAIIDGSGSDRGKVGIKVNGTFTPINVTTPTAFNDDGTLNAAGKITLPAEMLGTAKVEITGTEKANYSFADINGVLASTAEPATNDKWRVSNNAAKYTTYVNEYRQFDADNRSITYKAEAVKKDGNIEVNLVTVTGLPKGFKVDSNGKVVNADGEKLITLNTKTNVITVNDAALNKGTITVTGDGYTLDVENDKSTKDEQFVWTISGTTATLKQGKSEGYDLESDNTKLVYHQADAQTPLATITGLKSGLKVEGGKLGIYDGGEFKEVATIENSTIKLTEYALGTSNITLTKATGQEYKLAEVTSPANTSMWVVSGTTATLKEATLASFALDEDGTKLTRTAPKISTTVLATVKGIKKGTVADAFGNIDGISYDTNNVITLSANVLNEKSKVSVTGEGYSLALDTTSTDSKKVPEPTNASDQIWKVSGTTLTIGTGKTAGYVIPADGTDKGKIVYQDVTQDASPAITITNLKSGLKLNADGKIDGIEIGDSTAKTITLSKAVLGTNTSAEKAMKLTASGDYAGYKLKLDDTDVTTSTPEKMWVISGTTASYKEVTPKGYTLASDGKSITYNAAIKNGTPEITITGLKKGIKLNADGGIDGVKVDSTTITLDSRALGTTAVKLTKGENYKLALDTDPASENAVSSTTESGKKWVVSGTTATYREVTPQAYTLANENKEIKYQSAKYGKVYATVKGLKSGLDVKNNGTIDGIDQTEIKDGDNITGYTVTLDNRALDKKDVSITGTDNKLEINTTDANYAVTKHEPSLTWTFNNGTATIVTTTPAGYKVEDNKVVYSTATTSKTTITGLNPNVIKAENQENVKTYFDTTTDGVITVKAAALDDTKKVSISGEYTLALATDVNSGKTITNSWKVDGTTAVYQQTLDAGTYYCDGKTISYQSSQTVKNLATIEGLAENLGSSTIGTDAIEVDDTNKTLKLKQAALAKDGTSVVKDMVKITSNAYKLALDEEVINATGEVTSGTVNTKTDKQTTDEWNLKNSTTATYGNGTEAYYTLSDDGRSVSYTPFKANEVKATLTGINKNGTLTKADLNSGITVGTDNVVSLNDTILKASPANISISGKSIPTGGGTANVDYTLAFTPAPTSTDGSKKTFGGDAFTAPKWYVNGTTITLEEGTEQKWVADETSTTTKKSIKYTAETHKGSSQALATLTNLVKGLTPDKDGKIEGIEVTAPTKDNSTGAVTVKGTIKISQEVLNQKDVTLSKGATDYEIQLAGVAEPAYSEPEISVSGTTATVKQDVLEGYTLNDAKNKITYTKSAEGTVLAKVTGLKSNFTEDDVTLDGTTIKIGVGALGTSKVALANQNGGNYTLALEDDVPKEDSDEVKDGANQWSVSGSTATLKKVKPAYYELAGDNKSIAVKSSTNSTIVTVSGLKSGLKAIDGEISGIEAIEPTYKTTGEGNDAVTTLEESGLIVLDAQSVLGTSTVKISNGADYKLQVEGYDTPEISGEAWTNSKGSATLKGKISKGFTMSDDERTLTYSSEVKSATLATIKGLNTATTLTADHLDTDNQTIALTGEDLTEKVTIGGGKYAFDFGADYENASITGSTSADVITVNGVGVSINAGKGDDYVSMYGYGTDETDTNKEIGDTFIYASGDGNDVIADFSSYDKIKLTSGTITADSIKFGSGDDGEDDVVISIGTGSITLLDWDNSNEIHIVGTNNAEQIFKWDNSNSVFKAEATGGGRAVLDEEFSMDPTELTSTSNAIVTGGNDKK